MTEQEAKVNDWTDGYISALNQNFYNETVKSYERMIETDSDHADYAKGKLEDLRQGDMTDLYTWKVIKGRKYNKIVQQEWDENLHRYRNGSVHAFVDRKTGEVYKPAGWQNVAKHVRYDMRIIKDREFLHNPDNISWAGGHLYIR